MSRLLALLAAIGLIVGAVIVRGVLDDEDNGPESSPPRGDEPMQIVCSPEVARACAALDPSEYDVTQEDAAVTATRLSGPDELDIDAWVVPAPWPAMVDDMRVRAGRDAIFDDASVVARSPITIVAGGDPGDCGWKCIGDGTDRLGAPAPTSGLGLLVLGAAATGWFGTADFATNDFDPAFQSWITALADRIVAANDPVTRMLQSPAFFDLAVSFEADATAALEAASADRREGLSLQYPRPVTYLDATVAAIGDSSTELVDVIGAELLDRGWTTPDDTPSGLPRAGVLLALRELV